MHYLRRKAYDSAIIYFRDVVTQVSEHGAARDALLRLAEAYGAIKYKDDKADVCKTSEGEVPRTIGEVAAHRARPAADKPVVAPGRQ